MVVLKFGGSSVKDSNCINNIIDITLREIENSPVIVSSAMGKTTNNLLSLVDESLNGEENKIQEIYDDLLNHHILNGSNILSENNFEKYKEVVTEYFSEIKTLSEGILLTKECSLRTRDTLLSFGERLSTTLIYFGCVERDISCELLDARDFIKTNSNFSCASVNFAESNKLIKELVVPEKNKIIITQGFIGSNLESVTTTLGRGGSDYTSTIIGAALDAENVQIWTDVTGIMTSDPRIITGCKTIDHMTYSEAAELAYFGAKVVHPATIQPTIAKNIPVWVKNTMEKDSLGTVITKNLNEIGLKAISGKKNVTLVNITSSKMLNAYGFLRKIFEVFEDYETPVDLISTSEVSVSVTIDDTSKIDNIKAELDDLGQVKIESDKSIICMVGQGLWQDSKFITRVFSVLSDTPIRMISLGSSDTNLSIVVPSEVKIKTIQLLHDEFFN